MMLSNIRLPAQSTWSKKKTRRRPSRKLNCRKLAVVEAIALIGLSRWPVSCKLRTITSNQMTKITNLQRKKNKRRDGERTDVVKADADSGEATP